MGRPRKGRTKMQRIPTELDDNLTRWSNQSISMGYPKSKTDVARTLALKMKNFNYRADFNIFKEPDIEDIITPPKRRKR